MKVDNEFYHYRIGWWENVERPSTDEMSVIETLEAQDLTGYSILHVGVGSSYLAKKFNTSIVTGLTNSILEYQKALSLSLPNYTPILIDKHDYNLKHVLSTYDIIVDVNIRSYSPSLDDAIRYFRTAIYHLNPGGTFFTHESGLAYRNPLTFEDLDAVGVPLTANIINNGTVLLTKYAE